LARLAGCLCVLASPLALVGVAGATVGTNPAGFVATTVAPVTLPDPGVVITPGGNTSDPFVIEVGGIYYMFSAQAAPLGPSVPLMVSTSLTSWDSPAVEAMPTLPSWSAPGFTWSPDVRALGGHYAMWFSAAVAGGQYKCIGVATSASVTGPYVSSSPHPLVCQFADLGSIDPRTFVDPEGRLWLLWKSDDNADVTADTHSTIYAQQLSPDGTQLLGNPVALLTADLPWEGRIVESPDMVYAAGRYWLFFSGNWYNQSVYAIGVAQCEGPTGPCEPTSSGPWLGSNAQGSGPGEESLFFDGSRWWLLYAPNSAGADSLTRRPVALARVTFGPNGPAVVPPGTAAWDQPDPSPGTVGAIGRAEKPRSGPHAGEDATPDVVARSRST
jgi:beta-xylosidase